MNHIPLLMSFEFVCQSSFVTGDAKIPMPISGAVGCRLGKVMSAQALRKKAMSLAWLIRGRPPGLRAIFDACMACADGNR